MADAFVECRDNCVAVGMDGFLTRLLDREQFMTAIADRDLAASRAA